MTGYRTTSARYFPLERVADDHVSRTCNRL